MEWKYLEVLTAKMTLGSRKKVHHARQNQKAFWSRGRGVSSLGLSSTFFLPVLHPHPLADSVRGVGKCS